MSSHMAFLAVLNSVRFTFQFSKYFSLKKVSLLPTKLAGDHIGVWPRHLLGAAVAVEPGAVQGRPLEFQFINKLN